MENRIPIFKRGMILDREMLDSLKDLSLDYQSLKFQEHSDGIISGLQLRIEGDEVYISQGLIKINGSLYKVLGESSVIIPEEDGEYVCGFSNEVLLKEDKFIKKKLEIVLLKDKKEDLEFSLFKINRRKGAEIRLPEKFTGQLKEYNLLNIVNLASSTASGKMLPKGLMHYFAEELLLKTGLGLEDKLIAYFILNNSIERKTVEKYICEKQGVDCNKADLESLYRILSNILEGIKESKSTNNTTKRKMMVE